MLLLTHELIESISGVACRSARELCAFILLYKKANKYVNARSRIFASNQA